MNFDAKKVKNDIVKWIRDWFEINGKGCNAIVGISGGKDSSVVAALCAEALGKERVYGVLMPNGEQADIDMSLWRRFMPSARARTDASQTPATFLRIGSAIPPVTATAPAISARSRCFACAR